jgi:hypothetical protein
MTDTSTTTSTSVSATDDNSKPFWASQTIWSAIAVVGSSVTGAILAWKSQDMASFGVALTAALGGVNAIIGRVRASAVIKS